MKDVPDDPLAEALRDLHEAREVAAGVKHDVNNLLMGLLGHLTLLGDRSDLSEPARKKVQIIEQQGKKIRDRIADLDRIRASGGKKK